MGIYSSASHGAEEALNAWFLNCKAYYTIENSKIKYATPIIFADKGDIDSRSCEISNRKTVNTEFLFYSPPEDYSTEKAVPITQPKSELCGDICYNFTSLNADDVRFNVSSWTEYSIGSGDLIFPSINYTNPTPPNGSPQTVNSLFVNFLVNDPNDI